MKMEGQPYYPDDQFTSYPGSRVPLCDIPTRVDPCGLIDPNTFIRRKGTSSWDVLSGQESSNHQTDGYGLDVLQDKEGNIFDYRLTLYPSMDEETKKLLGKIFNGLLVGGQSKDLTNITNSIGFGIASPGSIVFRTNKPFLVALKPGILQINRRWRSTTNDLNTHAQWKEKFRSDPDNPTPYLEFVVAQLRCTSPANQESFIVRFISGIRFLSLDFSVVKQNITAEVTRGFANEEKFRRIVNPYLRLEETPI